MHIKCTDFSSALFFFFAEYKVLVFELCVFINRIVFVVCVCLMPVHLLYGHK